MILDKGKKGVIRVKKKIKINTSKQNCCWESYISSFLQVACLLYRDTILLKDALIKTKNKVH